MNAKLCALLGVLAACSLFAAPAQGVVNGSEVDAASVPWFVALPGCGATLVAPDRLLTAAHCVRGRPPIEFGRFYVGANVRSVKRFALHPGWRRPNGSANFFDDVALLELDAPVHDVPLVRLGGTVPREASILGYGLPFAPGSGHSESETYDLKLRSAPLRTIGDAECARLLRGYRGSTGERFDARMRCAIDADGKAPLYSGCNGDSGGPLWTGSAQAPVQLGVVSWGGDRCGADHLPSVFADVALYRGFITDPAPVWAPSETGGAIRITGTARAGRTLTCTLRGYVTPSGAKIAYRWSVVGTGRGGVSTPRAASRGRKHTVTRRERGKRLACFAEASNDGGWLQVGAATRLVPR